VTDLSTVRDVALGIVVGAVVLAVVVALVVKWIVGKLVLVVVLGALAAVVWWQRASVVDCAHGVHHRLAEGQTDGTTCRFFGRDVTVGSSPD